MGGLLHFGTARRGLGGLHPRPAPSSVPNVTAFPSTTSVPMILRYDGLLLYGFNVAIKALIYSLWIICSRVQLECTVGVYSICSRVQLECWSVCQTAATPAVVWTSVYCLSWDCSCNHIILSRFTHFPAKLQEVVNNNNINNNNNNSKTMFMVLSSIIARVHLVHLMDIERRQAAADPKPSHTT